jgi:hypothetical protein
MLSSNVVGVDVYDNANHDLAAIKEVAFDSSKALKGYIPRLAASSGWAPLRCGRGRFREDQIRHDRQKVARKYECQQGRAQERARVQIRRRVEHQQVVNGTPAPTMVGAVILLVVRKGMRAEEIC